MMKDVLNELWELFFPRCCVVCGQRLRKGECFICLHCLSELPRTNFHLLKNKEVEQNFWGKFPIERATSFLYYAKGGDVRRLLYELKYYGNKEIGEFLGKCMATELLSSHFFNGIDYIIPVPLHRKKERKRGYNQCEWLARGIASVTNIPIASHVVKREIYTDTQTHKSQYERWENVEGGFVLDSIVNLEDKHVLLVDDVLTTGATIVACADAFKGVSGIKISVLTFALAGQT